MNKRELTLKRLKIGDDLATLQKMLMAAPRYQELTEGCPVPDEAAQQMVEALPAGKTHDDKFVYLIMDGERAVACADIIRGYPSAQTAWVGLLLLPESDQRRGEGTAAYACIERVMRGWDGVRNIRLAIVETNAEVISFWEKQGFARTGKTSPYQSGAVSSTSIIFEKPVSPFSYRLGRPGDEAEIASVHIHAWQESYRGIIPDPILDDRPLGFRSRRNWWLSVVEGREPLVVFVAEHVTHGIVGFCSAGKGREEGRTHEGEVPAFYLLNQAKRKGVGRTLFVMAQDYLRSQGYRKMYVSVLSDNPAVRFYEAVGGRLVKNDRKITIGVELNDSLYEWEL